MGNAFHIICDDWKLDARQEEPIYFYHIDELERIIQGKKHFIIGRKGAGKTAIAKKLFDAQNSNIYSQKLSFKNFPFNFLYSLDNVKYTYPNQYITLWKYLIYSCICKLMLKNQKIEKSALQKLKKLYDELPIEALDRLLGKWTTKEFGLQILGNGLSISRDYSNSPIEWIGATDILEDFIITYVDNSTYLIIFDELDEDYRSFQDSEEKSIYTCLLTGLFKAVQEIRSKFHDNKHIFPVVFLRQDIYSLLRDSDKTKWNDFMIELEWKQEKIKRMLDFRLNASIQKSGNTTTSPWSFLFSPQPVKMGHEQKNTMNSFEYITRSTQLRPRDYIFYITQCAEQAISENKNIISPGIIKQVDDRFSDYLRSEIIDEVHPVLPHIEDIFDMLSKIRKQTFAPILFTQEYSKNGNFKKIMGSEEVLKHLFDFNIIGNVPSMRGKTVFKYESKHARFNFRENIMIHRGLFKALQIF